MNSLLTSLLYLLKKIINLEESEWILEAKDWKVNAK